MSDAVDYKLLAEFLGEAYYVAANPDGDYIWLEDFTRPSDADLVMAVLRKLASEGFGPSLDHSTGSKQWFLWIDDGSREGLQKSGPTPILAVDALVKAMKGEKP